MPNLASRPFERLHQAQVLLSPQKRKRVRGKIGGDYDFAENLADGFGTRQIQRAIDHDDSAKRSLYVGCESLFPSLTKSFALARPTRIAMLENGQRGRAADEFRAQGGGRSEVEDIVIGQFLAVQLLEIILKAAIKRGALMRILPVAQCLREAHVQLKSVRPSVASFGRRRGFRAG